MEVNLVGVSNWHKSETSGLGTRQGNYSTIRINLASRKRKKYLDNWGGSRTILLEDGLPAYHDESHKEDCGWWTSPPTCGRSWLRRPPRQKSRSCRSRATLIGRRLFSTSSSTSLNFDWKDVSFTHHLQQLWLGRYLFSTSSSTTSSPVHPHNCRLLDPLWTETTHINKTVTNKTLPKIGSPLKLPLGANKWFRLKIAKWREFGWLWMRDDAKQTDREDRTLARLGTNICFMLMCPLTIYSQLPQFNSTAFVATNNMFTAIQNLKAWLVLYLTIFIQLYWLGYTSLTNQQWLPHKC